MTDPAGPDALQATGDVQRTHSVAGPLDLRHTLGPGIGSPARRHGRQACWWASETPDGPGTVRARLVDDGPGGRVLLVDGWGPGGGWLADQAAARCGLLDRPGDLSAHHPRIARLARERIGMRLGRTGRVWEALLPVVLGQRVTTRGAAQSLRAVARRWGRPAPGPLALQLLPTAEALAGLSYAHLHPCNVEAARARTLLRIARVADRLEAIVGMERTAAYERLVAVKGIGPWSAPLVMAEAWGDADAVPLGDYHLPSTVAWFLAGERIADDRRMVALLRPYLGQRWRLIRLLHTVRDRSPRRGHRQEVVDIRDW